MFLIQLICICSYLCFNLSQYCLDYPGEIVLLYETIEDETFYKSKYGGSIVIHKYRKTVRRRGGIPNNNIQQQVQQQQIISVQRAISDKEAQAEGLSQEQVDGKDNQTDKEPLPVWKLVLPKNTMHAWINKIEDGDITEKFELGKDEFDNQTMTTSSSSSYVKTVDITKYDISSDSWYSMCIDLSVSYSKKAPTVCRHCTLLRTTTELLKIVTRKALSIELDLIYSSANTIRIKYNVEDIPWPQATVITKAFVSRDPATSRCLSGQQKEVVSEDLIFPETTVLVELNGLSDSNEYRLISALRFQAENDSTLAEFYLGGKSELTVQKCSRIT